ncbi:hypothetical protein A3B19_00490 [Candidatus Giovannonibacteria bacterium RIFCSPLOWO2_01_FULL_46_32]|uniref:Uncharacterized protein n=1 Tax=Candidatus Giovannonibacteria bacterium RIFCSPLOWO2_01_FULL_46_32 TaxID=1798353 RepID=A0A1F5XFD9_9BACT|nr:MAG: hypothetical protein A3B19_00490 [Candidatus Giovannonibacteria bacterium RIFCSPLOWO2_01_FULL_46_32]
MRLIYSAYQKKVRGAPFPYFAKYIVIEYSKIHMEEDAKKIQEIVEASNLGADAKARWQGKLQLLPPFLLRDLCAVLKEDPGNLIWMTKNWEMKESLLAKGGANAWNEIMAREEKDITSLLEQS